MGKGRGKLSSIDLMPDEADHIIAWAAQALSSREQTQVEIYAEFVTQCEALMAESRGEIEFSIPSMSSFNRYSMRQAKLTRRLDQTRQIVKAVSDKFDSKDADDLSIITTEAIKSLVLNIVTDAAEDEITSKEVMELAAAFKNAQQAQNISTDRRRKADEAFEKKVTSAVNAAAKTSGMTKDTEAKILEKILGVAVA